MSGEAMCDRPTGGGKISLRQQQAMRKVANVCPVFRHNFPSGFLLLFPMETSAWFIPSHEH